MSTTKSIFRICSAFMIVIFLVCSAPVQAQTVAVDSPSAPAGLSFADWKQIKAMLPASQDSQQAYLKASNTELGDEFGYSLAISGDTLVVGARREDSSATGINGNQADNSADDSGAVYVFIRSGDSWSQQAYLKASNTMLSNSFGSSVAISGNTLVVELPGRRAVLLV